MFFFTMASTLLAIAGCSIAAPSNVHKGDGGYSTLLLIDCVRNSDEHLATFYEPGLGACGIFNTENDPLVAVSTTLYDTFP